jgi:hypothetical protein
MIEPPKRHSTPLRAAGSYQVLQSPAGRRSTESTGTRREPLDSVSRRHGHGDGPFFLKAPLKIRSTQTGRRPAPTNLKGAHRPELDLEATVPRHTRAGGAAPRAPCRCRCRCQRRRLSSAESAAAGRARAPSGARRGTSECAAAVFKLGSSSGHASALTQGARVHWQ